MSDPTTKAGQKMLYEMGLDDPITGKGRHDHAVMRIRAIEAEAVSADHARLAAAVRGLPLRGLFGEGPAAAVIGRAAVLALLEPER